MYNNAQKYTIMYRNVQQCTKVYNNVQKWTIGYKYIQTIYNSTQNTVTVITVYHLTIKYRIVLFFILSFLLRKLKVDLHHLHLERRLTFKILPISWVI